MGRKTIYDILSAVEFRVYDEYKRLIYLFRDEKDFLCKGRFVSVQTYIDSIYFRKLPISGTYTSIGELMDELGIQTYYFPDELDDLFVLSEFLIAVLPENYTRSTSISEQRKTIFRNIECILEKTNHYVATLEDNKKIIVPNNEIAIHVAEIIEDNTVSLDVLKYNHYSLKGDLEGKKSILMRISQYLEPILNSKAMSKAGFATLESDVSFLINKFHIRHNNKDGTKKQEYISKLTDEELELWYDKTYDTILAFLSTRICLDTQREIKELKKNYNWVQ